jgi:hypothetical protein
MSLWSLEDQVFCRNRMWEDRMNEANDFERSETMPPSGSAGDGGVVEEAGTLGGMTADADGEIVQEERNAPGTPASES